MTRDGLRRARVAAQLLHRPKRSGPAAIVRHLLGVQAQIVSAAGLGLRARTEGLTAARVDRARLQDRSIVWTWAMRGTLHLIAAEDYGWLVPLTVEAQARTSLRRLREMGMSGDVATRATSLIERMLKREGPLTRAEIAQRLERTGIPTGGQIIAHLTWLAAGDRSIVFGPPRNGKTAFVLARDWVGETKAMSREAALAELAVRYLKAHGPSLPSDLALWSGIRAGDAARGWRAIEGRLVEVPTAGGPLWMLKSQRVEAPPDDVRLLPSFDEYLLGWKDRSYVAAPKVWRKIHPGAGWYHPAVVADGRATGTWKTEKRRDGLAVRVEPFSSPTPSVREGVAREARDVGRFLGRPAEAVLG